MERARSPMPQARGDGLVVQQLPDETLVYDLTSHKAHCLNRTAALVWSHCNGKTSVAKIAALLESELDIPADEEVVWLALDRLGKANLLQERVIPPADGARYSRRDIVRKLGLAAALLPLVTSIIAPTAAQAASCKNNGTPCMVSSECCNNCCKLVGQSQVCQSSTSNCIPG